MLDIHELTVSFGAFTAVDAISFSVNRGEIFGFLGPNGAGKTTTIKVLTGQLKPTGGTISVNGRNLFSDFNILKPLIGYVPDFDNHFEELSAFENLQLFSGLFGIPGSRVTEVLSRLELAGEAALKVAYFSKGMKKKLLIARELLHNPELLYLDEPTANLDVHSAEHIRKVLREMRGAGAAVVVTTHNMEEAEDICDRIAIIDHGRIVAIDSPAGLRTIPGGNVVAVTHIVNGRNEQEDLDLNIEKQREKLASLVDSGSVLFIHSKEADLRQVFLRLTGREYR